MIRRAAALVLACWAISPPGPAATRMPEAAVRAVEGVSEDDLRGYVGTLASDELNGRAVGDKGNRAAEEFICATLRLNGVTPAGVDGSCYQPVEVYSPALGSGAHLTVSNDEGTRLADLASGADFYPLPETGDGSVTAPVVFVDYGISAPAQKHDDYARVNARGAI